MSPDDQILAAELALGLLEGPDIAAAEVRLLADPAFAAEVAWWRERSGALVATSREVAPGADLLPAIEARMAERPAVATLQASPRGRWFAAGAALGALAASIAALALMPGPRVVERIVRVPVAAPAAPPPLVAILAPGEGTGREPVAAVFDQQTRTLRLTATITVPADRAAELWRIGSDNVPRALGLLTAERGPIRLDEDHVLQPDEVIAISIEPLGGSPTGSPTGEVIASGALRPT